MTCITEEIAKKARRLRATGLTYQAIGDSLGISGSSASRCVRGLIPRKKRPKARQQSQPKPEPIDPCMVPRRALPDAADANEVLALDLRPEDAERLDKMQAPAASPPRRKRRAKTSQQPATVDPKRIDPHDPERLKRLDLCWRRYPDLYPAT